MPAGEELAWETLLQLDPADVCRQAEVTFDESKGAYTLKSFLQDVFVSVKDKCISGDSSIGDLLINEHGDLSRISMLMYLIHAKDIPISGGLVKPDDMPGGEIFQRGAHVLPLNMVAEKYGSDIRAFIRKGSELGGERLDYGDASIRLLPLPRVPVSIILWGKDKEFPARCSLLLDSTCRFQVPIDIIWSTALLSVLMLL